MQRHFLSSLVRVRIAMRKAKASPKLPQELFEEILDQLADQPRFLKACSLVCRAWVSRSRCHLFETCSLDVTNIVIFGEFLQSPRCTFMQHVRYIKATRFHLAPNDRFFDEITAGLRRLKNVRALQMKLSATKIDGYFLTGFITAFPQITRLVLICYFDFPHSVPFATTLGLFPALQVLEIREDSACAMQEPPREAMVPKGLHSLYLSKSVAGPILGWLLAAQHLPNVDSVTLPLVKRSHGQIVREALQELGYNLLHLDITLSCFLGAFYGAYITGLCTYI
ncbi:hypothetical protein B0H19DRAFT_166093 [Mycena capillaripes]|nr:hypothetical protein B0H19DRAFT_166093 [Mycena capillaripes]